MHCARMNYWPFSFRLQERLKRKDPVQTRLEQLEKGFSLYVNGANSELRKYRRKITPLLRNRSKATRTKGECHGSLAELHQRGHCGPGTAPEKSLWSRTAPERSLWYRTAPERSLWSRDSSTGTCGMGFHGNQCWSWLCVRNGLCNTLSIFHSIPL